MPQELISFFLLACEKALTEGDGIMSAIRIVDAILVSPAPNLTFEQTEVPLGLIGSGKVAQNDDQEHLVEVKMVRPDGETTTVGKPYQMKFTASESTPPPGFNFSINVRILAKQFGTHWFTLSYDGVEVVRTPVTLQPLSQIPAR